MRADGPAAAVTARGARGADGAEPPQLPRSLHARRRCCPRSAPTLHLTDAQAGLAADAVHPDATSLVSPLAGWLGDRRAALPARGGRRARLERRDLRLGAGARRFAVLVVARALTGVGEASYTVVTPSLLSDFYPPDRRGRALAIFYAAIPIGSAVGYVAGRRRSTRTSAGARRSSSRAARARCWRSRCSFLRDPPRGALRRRSAARRRKPSPRREALRALRAAPELRLQHRGADHLHVHAWAGSRFWMPTYFVRVRHLPLRPTRR